jgi:glycosyltransferase involved in cell wall biosynthesis
MYRRTTVGVVVPAYNEEGLVGDVIETIPEFVDRIYAVDDCSTDGTWSEMKAAATRVNRSREPQLAGPAETDGGPRFEPRIVPIRHTSNRGVGGTVMTGYERALEDGMDVVAVMNGDGQMDPEILTDIVDPVVSGEADYAKGNRLLGPDSRAGMSRWRFFGNTLLTTLTKVSSGYWKMMDAQNGYTAISSEALDAIGPTSFYSDYGFLNDVLVKLNAYGFTVTDVPMRAVYGEESSSIRYHRFVPGLSWLLLRNFLWRLKVKYLVYDFHPLALLYFLGAGTTVLGAAVAVSASAPVSPALTDGLILAVLGCFALVFAMVFDMRENEDLEVRQW